MTTAHATCQIVRQKVRIGGVSTSVSMEAYYLDSLKEMATETGVTFQEMVRRIAAESPGKNLSRAVRLAVIAYYRTAANLGRGRR